MERLFFKKKMKMVYLYLYGKVQSQYSAVTVDFCDNNFYMINYVFPTYLPIFQYCVCTRFFILLMPLNFIHSEKITKIWWNIPLRFDITYLLWSRDAGTNFLQARPIVSTKAFKDIYLLGSNVKAKRDISSNLVAFSEYMHPWRL